MWSGSGVSGDLLPYLLYFRAINNRRPLFDFRRPPCAPRDFRLFIYFAYVWQLAQDHVRMASSSSAPRWSLPRSTDNATQSNRSRHAIDILQSTLHHIFNVTVRPKPLTLTPLLLESHQVSSIRPVRTAAAAAAAPRSHSEAGRKSAARQIRTGAGRTGVGRNRSAAPPHSPRPPRRRRRPGRAGRG